MRKNVISAIFVLGFSILYSQDSLLIEKIQKLTLTEDRLKKELDAANGMIVQLKSTHQSNVSDLNAEIENLKRDTAILNKRINKLDKKNFIKDLESSLEVKKDSISKLKDSILTLEDKIKLKDQEIKAIGESNKSKEVQKYAEGRLSVYRQIANDYQSKTFDELISSFSEQSLDRDFPYLNKDDRLVLKLQDLKKYYSAMNILKIKFDAQKQQAAKNQLNTITEASDSLANLKLKIERYELRSGALKKAIDDIITLDKKLKAIDDPQVQIMKLTDVLIIIAGYVRNYQFNFRDYPYLSDIILEILKRKQKNPNADISDLVSKL